MMLLGLKGVDSSGSEHDYESLPSSFEQQHPEDSFSVYAHIDSLEEDPDSPPYVPVNGETHCWFESFKLYMYTH